MNKQRRSKFILGTGSAYLFNVVSFLITIISVPIGLEYFGVERYGALAIITTILTYLTMANFGIPGAAVVLTAKALDKLEQFKVIAKSLLLLILFSAASLFVFIYFSKDINWFGLLGRIPAGLNKEVYAAAFYASILYLANLPFALFTQVFSSIQKVHVTKIYDIVTVAVVNLAALIATVALNNTLVFYFVLRGVLIIAASITGMLHFILLEETNKQIHKFKLSSLLSEPVNREFSFRYILLTGVRLFFMGLAAMIVWHTDNFVISYFRGLGAVTPYSITFRLIAASFILFTTLNITLNPMYGNAFAAKDYTWIESVYNKIASIQQILGGLVWIGSVAFAKDIIGLWTGPSGYAGMLTVFVLGGYGYSLSLVHTHSGLYTSINMIKNCIFISWSEAVINLLLSLILVRFLGVGGVALGTFSAALLTVFWMLPLEINRRTKGRIKFNHSRAVEHFFKNIFPSLAAVLLLNIFIRSGGLRISASALVVLFYSVVSYRRLEPEVKKKILDFIPGVRA